MSCFWRHDFGDWGKKKCYQERSCCRCGFIEQSELWYNHKWKRVKEDKRGYLWILYECSTCSQTKEVNL